MSKLRCPFSKQKQNKNRTQSQQNHKKNIVKEQNKTKQIKTHKDTANQKQAFAIFFVFVLL